MSDEHVLDGLGLIRRLLEREGLLQLAEDGVRRREGVAGQRRALRIQLQQLLRDLARLGGDPAPLFRPGLAAQLVQADGAPLRRRHSGGAVRCDRPARRPGRRRTPGAGSPAPRRAPPASSGPGSGRCRARRERPASPSRDLAKVAQRGRLGWARTSRCVVLAEDLVLGHQHQPIAGQAETVTERTRQHRHRAAAVAGRSCRVVGAEDRQRRLGSRSTSAARPHERNMRRQPIGVGAVGGHDAHPLAVAVQR